ncbi:MAG: glycerol-3-phosphate 1-O-acyltransferase PlsY [Gammaproteobacteria bacterium]
MITETIISTILAYLIGSLSSSVLIAKAFGLPDPREIGSKNPGATNMLRIGGKKIGFMTLFFDAFKGFLPVFVAPYFGLTGLALNGLMMAVFLGHLFPLFFGFKGGKGVATALGALLGLDFRIGLAVLGIWIGIAFIWRYSSLASLLAAAFSPVLIFVFKPDLIYAGLFMAICILIAHKGNIQRLLGGQEPRLGSKKT